MHLFYAYREYGNFNSGGFAGLAALVKKDQSHMRTRSLPAATEDVYCMHDRKAALASRGPRALSRN